MTGRKFTEEEGEKLTGVKAHVIVFFVIVASMMALGFFIG